MTIGRRRREVVTSTGHRSGRESAVSGENRTARAYRAAMGTVVGRDGRWSRARSTLGRLLRPPVTITDPPDDATVDWDVAVPMRDGIRLRVNVFRPGDDAPHPAPAPSMCQTRTFVRRRKVRV